MEKLADKGNGNYAYIDDLAEAEKVLYDQMTGTLVTIAKDVKVQVEFNPARVAAYRLIGYENRTLRKEDFNDDTKDAGEVGAGHTVTALYEIVPAGVALPRPRVDRLRYQRSREEESKVYVKPAKDRTESFFVKLRYKDPDGTVSKRISFPVVDGGRRYSRASADFKFAASVASFGMILKESPYRGDASMASVIELAGEGIGRDRTGHRREFIRLARRVRQMRPGG
jgi:Ca-activated chloride channel family protein